MCLADSPLGGVLSGDRAEYKRPQRRILLIMRICEQKRLESCAYLTTSPAISLIKHCCGTHSLVWFSLKALCTCPLGWRCLSSDGLFLPSHWRAVLVSLCLSTRDVLVICQIFHYRMIITGDLDYDVRVWAARNIVSTHTFHASIRRTAPLARATNLEPAFLRKKLASLEHSSLVNVVNSLCSETGLLFHFFATDPFSTCHGFPTLCSRDIWPKFHDRVA